MLFQSGTRDVVKRLANKEFNTAEERDALLARLASAEDLRPQDLVWTLFRPDRVMRDAGAKLLQRLRDPETLSVFITEAKGKPEAAFRAATGVFFSLGLPGVESELPKLLAPAKETKEALEIQDLARRMIAEAPASRALEPLLWQLAATGSIDDRIAFLARLAAQEPDERGIVRWQRLVQDADPRVREKALEVLATRAPMSSVDLFVQHLPLVSYNVQQVLIEALTRAAATQPPEFAEQLLPLVASGDAGTRSAAMKILLGMRDRSGLVKRYIRFTQKLAGFVRDRAIESIRAFGDQVIDSTIELLGDPDADLRAAAIAVAGTFEDQRIVPATIVLLKDPDWWIRIVAAETLGRLKDPRAVEPLIALLAEPEAKWAAVEALGHLADPRALSALGRMLGDPEANVRIEVMQSLRNFNHPQVVTALTQMATKDPERAVRMRALDILEEIEKRENASVRSDALAARPRAGEPKLHAFLISTRNSGASDFHLSVGQPPIVRMAADLLRAQGEPFTAEQTEALLREILTDAQWEHLRRDQQLDFCHYIPQAGRYRANVFLDHSGMNAVFRVIPEKSPTIQELGLPAHLAEVADYHQGLILICGPSGSGKSTTLAALVNLFNETRTDHILTMEDPVEFVHPFKNCLINQREVGTHTESFARALRAALREDPDVIVIGELRDNESVALALTAAETGHVVLGTLSATSAPKAIDRLISSFSAGEQPQIRASLSESLKYVIAQRLLPAKEERRQVACFEVLKGTMNIANMIRTNNAAKTMDRIISVFPSGEQEGIRNVLGETIRAVLAQQLIPQIGGGRVAALEILFSSPAIGNMIREGKTSQVTSAIQTGVREGMVDMDTSIRRLYEAKRISARAAYDKAIDKESFKDLEG
ncbi:MAG TPA: PilT/PilU family type 4a pilus ATPase [Thermoanaerobaculia bacterium]|nr:PilT/PilU family type 4a pilus ATPase [Thermoanaerobaculia bacterium]